MENPYGKSQFGRYGARAYERRAGRADDAGSSVFLRRSGASQERPFNHDAELYLDGRRHHSLGASRI